MRSGTDYLAESHNLVELAELRRKQEKNKKKRSPMPDSLCYASSLFTISPGKGNKVKNFHSSTCRNGLTEVSLMI